MVKRLGDEKVDRIIFYAEPIDSPGWRPYYDVIATACEPLGVDLVVRPSDAARG